MSDPIPDEVLRRAVASMAAGDKIRLLTEAGHETLPVKQVFMEFLALREAARGVDRARHALVMQAIFGIRSHIESGKPGKPAIEVGDLIANEYAALEALRALLPEEPK